MEEAMSAGEILKKKNILFDIAFTSMLKRAQDTNQLVLHHLNQTPFVVKNKALNERDYGDLTGKNKDLARAKWGEEQVHIWRRSYHTRPPNGESLKDTKERAVGFYQKQIAPCLLEGKHILITAHGNSLRGLVMFLENIPEDEISKLNIETGCPLFYECQNELGLLRTKRV